MKRIVRTAFAFALLLPALIAVPAAAQYRPTPGPGTGPAPTTPSTQPVPANSQVEIAYVEPKDAAFAPIRERLMRRRVLEQLQQFLSPLRLPQKLMVKIDQCGANRTPYQPGAAAVICYEHIAQVERTAPKETPPNGMPRETMIVGAFVQAVLNEVAQAVFEILEIPVWGREEDAADKLAGFIMVQFGKEIALKVLIGAAWYFEAAERAWAPTDFASVHSPEAQRFYNYLCIAYGADPATFKFLIDRNVLPQNRAQRCAKEFFDLRYAFLATIMPHVDQARLKQVQSANWLILDEPR